MSPHERDLIGVIEDDAVMGGTLTHRLELEGYRPLWWRTGLDALEGLSAADPELVVSDIKLPDMNGEEVFLRALPRLGGKPFFFITAFGEFDQAVRLTKAGAVDYIAKPFAVSDLLERIARVLSVRPKAKGVLGESQAMRRIEILLRRVANIHTSLLLTGESGVGKEVAANFIHQISARAREPFIAVNCAAIPSELVESEVFGHDKGAFTGAQTRHRGYAERASAGVLFLDEIGELTLSAQAKLLRLIEERAFVRVGGEEAIKSNARIICGTNLDLDRAVTEGRFRKDLYYRINVISVEIPPLRDREEDVLPLAQKFMREFAKAFGRELHGFTPAAEQALLDYSWPGNVRELRNCVERGAALSEGRWIEVGALFPSQAAAPDTAPTSFRTLAEVRSNAERRHIRTVLADSGGRVEEASKLLGISRSTLFEKMRKLDIDSR